MMRILILGNFSDFVLSHIFAGAAEINQDMRAGHSSILPIYTYLLNLYFFFSDFLSNSFQNFARPAGGQDRDGPGGLGGWGCASSLPISEACVAAVYI